MPSSSQTTSNHKTLRSHITKVSVCIALHFSIDPISSVYKAVQINYVKQSVSVPVTHCVNSFCVPRSGGGGRRRSRCHAACVAATADRNLRPRSPPVLHHRHRDFSLLSFGTSYAMMEHAGTYRLHPTTNVNVNNGFEII